MIDEKALKRHFDWIAKNGWCWEFPDETIGGFFRIVGDDRKGLEKFLDSMEPKDMYEISGLFEDISEKWPDRKMTKFLEKQRLRMIEAGVMQ